MPWRMPASGLKPRATQGGAITYSGDGQVRPSVQNGGVVQKGEANEIDLPLSEICFSAGNRIALKIGRALVR